MITLTVLRSRGVAVLPAFLAALLAAEGASKAWQAMEDVHALAQARNREADDAAGAD